MIKVLKITLVVSVILALAACGSPGEQGSTPAPAGATKSEAKAARPDWEEKWEKAVLEGKKEGLVRIYGFWSPPARAGLSEAFKAKYGIDVEFVVGRGSELQPKIQAEQRAGLYLADIIGLGTNSLLVNMKPVGLLGPIEPFLILPEVLDPKAWPSGRIPFSDKDRLAIPMTANAQRYNVYNKTLIKEGELTSFTDALNPRYRGKIILSDPSIQGSGNAFFSHLAHNVLDLQQAKDFLRRLLTEQEAAVTRDYRGQVDAVARGKYAIGLGTQGSAVAEFVEVGAPIGIVPVKEIEISHEAGVMGVARVLPHPNAATVFINWLLTREGQTLFSRTSRQPVIRSDVSAEGINPLFVIQPTDKTSPDTEDYIIFKGQMVTVAKEIVDAYSKQK